MRVFILHVIAGLFAWLLAGFGVALLFKTRVLAFQVGDDPVLQAAPVRSQALPARRRR